MRAGSTGFDVFRSTGDLMDASRRVTLAAVANAGDDVAIGQLRAATAGSQRCGKRRCEHSSPTRRARSPISDRRNERCGARSTTRPRPNRSCARDSSASAASTSTRRVLRRAQDAARAQSAFGRRTRRRHRSTTAGRRTDHRQRKLGLPGAGRRVVHRHVRRAARQRPHAQRCRHVRGHGDSARRRRLRLGVLPERHARRSRRVRDGQRRHDVLLRAPQRLRGRRAVGIGR